MGPHPGLAPAEGKVGKDVWCARDATCGVMWCAWEVRIVMHIMCGVHSVTFGVSCGIHGMLNMCA